MIRAVSPGGASMIPIPAYSLSSATGHTIATTTSAPGEWLRRLRSQTTAPASGSVYLAALFSSTSE
jgi:hypothetical protein